VQQIGCAELHFHLWGIVAKGRVVLKVKGQLLFLRLGAHTHLHKTEVWGESYCKVQSKKMKIWAKNCVELRLPFIFNTNEGVLKEICSS